LEVAAASLFIALDPPPFFQSILSYDEGVSTRNTIEGNLVRDILYSSRDNVNFVHEVYRQAFLLSFR
jgi:hypothetical protein